MARLSVFLSSDIKHAEVRSSSVRCCCYHSLLSYCMWFLVLKAKTDAKPAVGAVKVEPTSSSAIKTEPSNLVSLQEMKDFIRSRGGSVPATQLTQQFKARIVVSHRPYTDMYAACFFFYAPTSCCRSERPNMCLDCATCILRCNKSRHHTAQRSAAIFAQFETVMSSDTCAPDADSSTERALQGHGQDWLAV